MVICHKKCFTKLCFTNLDSKVWDEDGKQKKRDFITFEIKVFIFKGFQLKFWQNLSFFLQNHQVQNLMKWTMEINIDTFLDIDIGTDVVVLESQNYVYVVI